MQETDKKQSVEAEKPISEQEAAIGKRRKLIGRVLLGSPAVLLMTTKSLQAQNPSANDPSGWSGTTTG